MIGNRYYIGLGLIVFCWLMLIVCNLSCGSSSSETTTTTSTTSTTTTSSTSTTSTTIPISSWAFVDGNGANGINKSAANNASFPQLTVFNSKLYATWYEYNANNQIRIVVYNGNDASPGWTFMDGDGANGINKSASNDASTPQLTAFNSKLYAIWREGNGTANQIRIAVYNGNDASPGWTFIDGDGTNGLNKSASNDASTPQLTAFNSKLYAIWQENNGTANQIRVVVYNGNDASPNWTFIDGNGTNGTNKDTLREAYFPQLTVFDSKLYATWCENNGTANQIRVAVYNGNDPSPSWTFIDGDGANGINKNASNDALSSQLTVFDSKLYASWYEDNGTANQIRVAVYNGNDSSPSWTFVDKGGYGTYYGINKDASKNAYDPQLTVFDSKLYATWHEYTGSGIAQIRVVVYNGNDASPNWTFIDGNGATGINKDVSQQAFFPQLTVFNSKLYSTWNENNGTASQIRVVVGR